MTSKMENWKTYCLLRLRASFEKGKTQLTAFTKGFSADNDTTFQLGDYLFLKVLYALETMGPKLVDILSANTITPNLIIEKYLELRREETLIQCFQPMFSLGKTTFLNQIFSNGDKVEAITAGFKDYQTLFGASFKPPANLEEVTKSNINATDPEFVISFKEKMAKRTEFLRQCEGLRDAISQVNEEYRKANSVISNTVNAFEEVHAQKVYVVRKLIAGAGEFLDLKHSPTEKYFIRLRFKEGTISRLSFDKKIDYTEASVSIVYWISGEGEPEFEPLDSNGAITDLKGKAGELITELPIGLIIRDVNISTLAKSHSKQYTLESADGNLNVSIELPKKGIWNQFAYNGAVLQNANHMLSLPNLLGVNLQTLMIDPETWKVSVTCSWTAISFLKELFHNDLDATSFIVTLDDLLQQNPNEFRKALRQAVLEKIHKQILAQATEVNLNRLKPFFRAARVYGLKLDELPKESEYLVGLITLENVKIPLLNFDVPTVEVRFNYDFLENQARLSFTQISLIDALPQLRERLKTEIQNEATKVIGALGHRIPDLARRSAELIDISSFNFNISDGSFNLVCEGESVSFRTAPEMLRVIQKIAFNYIRKNKDILIEKAKTAFEDEVMNAGKEALRKKCEELNNTTLNYFGLAFKLNVDCAAGKVAGTASYKEIVLRFIRENDEFKIISVDKAKVAEAILKQMNDAIGVTDKLLLSFKVVDEDIIIEARLKITELSFDGIVGRITINSKEVKFDLEQRLKDVQRDIEKALVSYYGDFEKEISISGYAAMRIKFESIDITSHIIVLKGSMTFSGGISASAPIEVNYKTGNIKVGEPNDISGQIIGALLKEFCAGLTDDPNNIVIGPIDFRSHSVTGSVKLKIWDQITLPTLKFTFRENKIDFDFKPSLTIPFVVPIAPPYASLIDPTVELDLDNKKLSFKGDFSVGFSESVRGFARLIKVKADLNIPYSKKDVGKVDYNGDMILASFFPMNKSRGVITIKGNPEVTLSESTIGKAEKIIKFSKITRFGRDPVGAYSFFTTGSIDVLKVLTASLNISGAIDTLSNTLRVSGTGGMALPVGTLQGGVGVSFVYSPMQGFIKDPALNVGGDISLCGFTLNKFSVDATEREAIVHFYVMGFGLTLHFPGVDAISVPVIRDAIINLLKNILNPKVLAKALLSLPKMDISLGEGSDANQPPEYTVRDDQPPNDPNGNGTGGVDTPVGQHGEGGTTGGQFTKTNSEKERGETGVSRSQPQKYSMEYKVAQMGHAEVGFTFAKYSDLDAKKETVYIAITNKLCIPLAEFIAYYQRCNGNTPDFLVNCFIYGNYSDASVSIPFDHHLVKGKDNVDFVLAHFNRTEYGGGDSLKKGESIIFGFTGANAVLDNMDDYSMLPLLPTKEGIDDFRMSDKFCLDLSSSAADRTTYSLGQYKLRTDEWAYPSFNFILAYNATSVKAFPVTAASLYNFPMTINSNKIPTPLAALYKTHRVIDYDDLYHLRMRSIYSNNDVSIQPAPSLLGARSNLHDHPACRIIKSYHRVLVRGRMDYVERNSGSKLSSDYQGINSYISNGNTADDPDIFIVQFGKDELWLMENPDTPIFATGSEHNYFKDYVDFTEKLLLNLNPASLLQILTSSCETGLDGKDVRQAIEAALADGFVERLAVYKLIDYINLQVRNKPIPDGYQCNIVRLDSSLRVTPITSINNEEWKAFFVIGNKQSIKTINFSKNDLSEGIGITGKTISSETFGDVPVLGKLLRFLYRSSGLRDKILLTANTNEVAWITVSEPGMLYILESETNMKPFPKKEIYCPPGLFSSEGTRGDFFNYPTLIKNHRKFFDRVTGILIGDSNASASLKYVQMNDTSRQLVGFLRTSTEVVLLIDAVNGDDIRMEKSIERSLFDANLNNATSPAVLSEKLQNNPRIREGSLVSAENFKDMADFILSSLDRSDSKVVNTNSSINPLALFNNSGIKTRYQ